MTMMMMMMMMLMMMRMMAVMMVKKSCTGSKTGNCNLNEDGDADYENTTTAQLIK